MKLQNDFLDALLKEITLRKDYLEGEEVSTIYFGGGTPSLLSEDHLQKIMKQIKTIYNVTPGVEITFEVNPDDIRPEGLKYWKSQGINRLSIGIQSFFEEDLKWMNRAHNAGQALDSIKRSQDEGFQNMSIDLIYGTPTLSDEKWEQNMLTAVSLDIPHLSCYALTVEQGTPLEALTRKKRVQPVSNEDQARQFLMMTDMLTAKGYEHYEISNLSLPGKRSVHNSSYWSGEKYLGLGPSAHSFNGISRQWNVANNVSYIKALMIKEIPSEQETLTREQQFNEYIMTSLRTIEGTDLHVAVLRFGNELSQGLAANTRKFIERGLMVEISGRLILTREGKLFADGIASELFYIV